MNEETTQVPETPETPETENFGSKVKRFLAHPITIQVGVSAAILGVCWGVASLLDTSDTEDSDDEGEVEEIAETEIEFE